MRVLLINLLALILAISIKKIEGQLVKAGKGVGKSCQRQTGCPIDLINNARSNGEFPPVPELQCYFKCLFQAMKIIRNDKISEEALNSQMNLMINEDLAQLLNAMTAHCIPEAKSSNICEAAYEFTVCGYKYNSSLYFFP